MCAMVSAFDPSEQTHMVVCQAGACSIGLVVYGYGVRERWH